MSDQEAADVRVKNEEIRKEREKSADEIANKFACFKRDFLSAPIRKAMNIVLKKTKGTFQACQIDYRKDERMWIFGSAEDVSVTYEINFESETDTALARIFLLELNDCKR